MLFIPNNTTRIIGTSITILMVLFALFAWCDLFYETGITGFWKVTNETTVIEKTKDVTGNETETTRTTREVIPGKTFWDLLDLIIIPAVLAGGAIWLNRTQRQRELDIAQEQRQRELDIDEKHRKQERNLAKDREEAEALQRYLEGMTTLLLEQNLKTSGKFDEVRTVARARTLNILTAVKDGSRKASVLRFLYEATLIKKQGNIAASRLSPLSRGVKPTAHPIVNLREAILGGANLRKANLSEADLRGTYLGKANLQEASLGRADLREADLREAILGEANLREADLRKVILGKAHLREAILGGADLREADLSEADLERANLGGADLRGAHLREAILGGAYLREAILQRTYLGRADLGGAILGEADLREADLREADLREAILSGANLSGANLRGAVLNGANLGAAVLYKATLDPINMSVTALDPNAPSVTDLSNADPLRANLGLDVLRGAVLRRTDLSGADLNGAIYDDTTTWPTGFDPAAAGAVKVD